MSMPFISSLKEPYRAVTKGKWKDLKELFDNDVRFSISCPMTVAGDNAFHIAVHSKREEPLKQLLEQVDVPMYASVLHTTNTYQNTVLHEAAINHNIAAVTLLVRDGYVTPEQLLERNESGQTPLFKAAAFGSTKVVKYLASQPNQMIASVLKEAHLINNDGLSILHAAVIGENFGTALCLLEMDKELAELKTKNGMTSLHLLTNSQSAFTEKYSNHLWHRLLNLCIPTGDDNYDDADTIDEDKSVVHVGDNQRVLSTFQAALETINKSFWKYFIGDGKWPTIVTKIWKEKRKRKFAVMLAKELIRNDYSWVGSQIKDTSKYFKPKETVPDDQVQIDFVDDEHQVETPLLAATRTGVIELVKEILRKHPQAVEHVSHKMQNILHVAASYRRGDIFEHVKKMEMPTRRLIMGIDEEGYTVLHHVADTRNYNGGTRPGPAYQLQEELEWFQMVEEIMPSYFTRLLDNKSHTAKELFKVKHEPQLKAAQQWIKETSQSCSGVAVLVATVVFAAAFTVPGGTRDDNGLPILLPSPFFMFFTVMDVVSLSSSLTAVVLFLSILTSPFELEDFRFSLPRRLTLGFALLFMSVATTMLAFTSTIILIIRSDQRRHWTLTLICCAAFVPVSVLALTYFPLIVSYISSSDFVSLIRAWYYLIRAWYISSSDFVSLIRDWYYLISRHCRLLLRNFTFLVHQRGLRFLNFLRNLVRQDDHPLLEDERNV